MKANEITNIRAAEKYLSEHGVQPLTGGKSGAQVCDIAGKYVLKRMRRDGGEKELFESCRREVLWYESAEGSVRDCIHHYIVSVLAFLPAWQRGGEGAGNL